MQFSGRAMAEMQCNRRAFTSGMASLLLGTALLDPARGQQLEHSSLKLGVANKAHLYYLPVTIAERRGHFRDYGLAIAISDFEGGGQSFDALLNSSVDIAAGAYEHVLRAKAMGHDIRAVIELGRFPGVVLAVGKNRPFKSYADLKDNKIDLQTTFDDRFIKRATVLFDDPTNSDLETDDRRPEIDLNRFQD